MTRLTDFIAALPEDERLEIADGAARLIEEEATLRALRKARRMTQERLAEVLNVKQVSVSQIERRSDMLLSTLRSYVEAMGGTLDLVVKFDDRPPVRLKTVGELAEAEEARVKV